MKPILCNTQVVQNILAGRQTQDRRPIKPQPFIVDDNLGKTWQFEKGKNKGVVQWPAENKPRLCAKQGILKFAKYQVGDVLYVRETWRVDNFGDFGRGSISYAEYGAHVDYAAEGSHGRKFIRLAKDMKPELNRWYAKHQDSRYSPSIHMPKWAARIFLKVTAVRVERIQDISVDGVKAEGLRVPDMSDMKQALWCSLYFPKLWESIYPGSWDRNDWVFVYDFEMCEKP